MILFVLQDADLDLEALLLRTTSIHAREATLQLYDLLLLDLQSSDLLLLSSPSTATSTSTSTTTSSTQLSTISGIQIHLHGQHYVIASINTFSGRLEFKAVGEVSTSRESRLRNAADKVDRDRKLTGETLLRVRASVSSFFLSFFFSFFLFIAFLDSPLTIILIH